MCELIGLQSHATNTRHSPSHGAIYEMLPSTGRVRVKCYPNPEAYIEAPGLDRLDFGMGVRKVETFGKHKIEEYIASYQWLTAE